jgi:hypothetical protein
MQGLKLPTCAPDGFDASLVGNRRRWERDAATSGGVLSPRIFGPAATPPATRLQRLAEGERIIEVGPAQPRR